MDAQRIVDKVIGANRDTIKRIDEEIKQIVDNKLDTKTYHASDKAKEDGGKNRVEDKNRNADIMIGASVSTIRSADFRIQKASAKYI